MESEKTEAEKMEAEKMEAEKRISEKYSNQFKNDFEIGLNYLTIVQSDSSFIENGGVFGSWFSSMLMKDYSPIIKLNVLQIKKIWEEKSQDDFKTVARYNPNSIHVRRMKDGAFTKMINPENGNLIRENFLFAVLVNDHPDDGILFFSPSPSSMKEVKNWQMKILNSCATGGGSALFMPSFYHTWELHIEKIQNPKKKVGKIAVISKVEMVGNISEEYIHQYIEKIYGTLPIIYDTIINDVNDMPKKNTPEISYTVEEGPAYSDIVPF